MCVDRLYDNYGYNVCRKGVCVCVCSQVLVVGTYYFLVRLLLCRYVCDKILCVLDCIVSILYVLRCYWLYVLSCCCEDVVYVDTSTRWLCWYNMYYAWHLCDACQVCV